jgi:hypothetical protein
MTQPIDAPLVGLVEQFTGQISVACERDYECVEGEDK